jgi:hypothetical protein
MGKYLDILDRPAGEPRTRELSEQSEKSCNSAPLTSLNSRPPPPYEWPMRALEQRRPDKVGVARWEQAVADARAFLATGGSKPPRSVGRRRTCLGSIRWHPWPGMTRWGSSGAFKASALWRSRIAAQASRRPPAASSPIECIRDEPNPHQARRAARPCGAPTREGDTWPALVSPGQRRKPLLSARRFGG